MTWWHGEHDANAPIAAVRRLLQRMNGVDLRVWEEAGHLRIVPQTRRDTGRAAGPLRSRCVPCRPTASTIRQATTSAPSSIPRRTSSRVMSRAPRRTGGSRHRSRRGRAGTAGAARSGDRADAAHERRASTGLVRPRELPADRGARAEADGLNQLEGLAPSRTRPAYDRRSWPTSSQGEMENWRACGSSSK